jgi:hypothetical protein
MVRLARGSSPRCLPCHSADKLPSHLAPILPERGSQVKSGSLDHGRVVEPATKDDVDLKVDRITIVRLKSRCGEILRTCASCANANRPGSDR